MGKKEKCINLQKQEKENKKYMLGQLFQEMEDQILSFSQTIWTLIFIERCLKKYKVFEKIGGIKTILQWDNSPSNVSSKALEFYEKKKIERVEWPAKSPDLNPIKNIRTIVKRELEKIKVAKQAEIIENIPEIWKEN